jgi:tetratricopeptide (TPR) repeat protein
LGDFIPLPRGVEVGGYVLDELLGAGGFGAVYRAFGKSKEVVALKISHHPATRQTAQNLVRQQNEIEALMRLQHPALVSIFDYGTMEDQRLFLAMELVAGESLQDYLRRRGRLDPIEAIRIVRRVAEALAHCHERDIFHLDLKSSNIMISDPFEPRIKVLDFGLAQLASVAPRPETVWAGSPVYMAPESFDAGRSQPSAKIDLYALGTVFYEMLTAQLPFDAVDNWKLIAEKTTKDPIPLSERLPDVPPGVAQIMDALLQRDPAKRFGSAQLLSARLKDLYYDTLYETGATVPLADVASGQLTMIDAGHSPFAGRTREIERLLRRCESVLCGEAMAVAIVGEPGVGKSRLAAEVLTRAAASRQGIIVYGRCRQLGDLVPYSPLRESLAQLCSALAMMPGKLGRDVRERIRAAHIPDTAVLVGLAPETAELLARDPNAHTVENVSAALRLVGSERVARALASLLTAVAQLMPVFVVLEDLHWADEGTLQVLARICAAHSTPRTLLIATSRPTPEVAGIPMEQLNLEPLDAADSEELMRQLTGAGDELTRMLQHSIPLLSAGNPLVITQVLHNLEAESFLARDAAGHLQLGSRSFDDYQPPSSVSAVLERTLEQLRSDARAVLGVAALIGRQFQLSDVVGLGLFAAAAVHAAVDAAAAHLLCRADGDKITFAHDTVREHLESTVSPGRLPDIHGRIADRLAVRKVPAGTLGHHLERAGRHLPAAHAYFAAGLEADELHDPAGAANAFQRTVEVIARLPQNGDRDDLLARAAFELSRVAGSLGDTSEILSQLDRCAELIGAGRPRHEVALAGAYARRYYVQGNGVKAGEYSRRCLAFAKDDPELQSYQCLPANILGRTMCISGQFGQSLEVLNRGLGLAKESREYGELSHTSGLLGVALGFTGQRAAALAAAEECGTLAAALEDPLRILGAHIYRSALCEALYEHTEGVRWSTQLLAFAEEHAIGGLYVYVGTVFAGRHQFHLGRLDRARVLLSNSINLSSILKIGMLASWAQAFLGDVMFVGGRFDDARAVYTRGLEIAKAANDDYAGPMNAMGLAHTMAVSSLDDPTPRRLEVRRLADGALAQLDRAGNVAARPWMLQRYAESLEAMGDDKAALDVRRQQAAAAAALSFPTFDFWPRTPPTADAPTPQAYWKERGISSNIRPLAPDTGSDTQETGIRRSHLLEQLSTVVGYKPPF